ncbi:MULTISPECIES: STAS domain-containing protein [Caballeronia]|jgi:rsbT co-antagonist protein RsbR|uniref:STAS domain-containing protein n=3 Tax=Caballeronia TaxID=1827195 RepID=A0ACB5QRY9_9BURK|nr:MULTISPECIES: STAS domain-containing protein [Caballeronia]GJH13664.1 STAS domain-containing protein [Caballeronia novacaledonica]GJH17385.1 STAS domain-containing protein [Caballeronia novacaledonica]GJH30777.1 STAS domain-containing protein [Caballeronia novacaledonica]
MEMVGGTRLAQLFTSNQEQLLTEWFAQQHAIASRRGLVGEAELRNQFTQFVSLLMAALASSERVDFRTPAWQDVRAFLSEMSAQRARQGFTPVETAMFVFSLKQPLFTRLRDSLGNDAATLADLTWTISTLFDELGLFTTEVFQTSREQVIVRQQQELLELSTPVVQLWDGILALPLIGTLDSARTQVVMENLLQKIVETGAAIAIIDITGVPTVDTLVAQHLLKTVAAARLMGADCIISGIRPQIAQTIVHLGVNLSNVTTKATLAAAFIVALQRTGKSVTGAYGQDAGRAVRSGDGLDSLQPE